MKIALISKSEAGCAEAAKLLRSRLPSGELVMLPAIPDLLISGGDPSAPDLLVLNEPSIEDGELDRVERLSHLYPRLACIIVSRNNTPEFLIQAMRAGVREVLPAPVNGDALLAAIQRIEAKRSGQAQSEGKIMAFISCKGGSGATFLAANLGYALSTLKKRVALVDLNLQFGDASLFVSEQKPMATIADVAQQMHRLDASFLDASMIEVAPGYNVLAAPEDPAQANDVRPEHVDKLLKLLRRNYDYILLDVGRNLDAVSIGALDQADIIFPVLQTTLPYIRDGKRLLAVFQSLDYRRDKIQLIVNRHEKSGDIRLEDVQRALGMKMPRTIPNHYEAAAASVNQGVPILKLVKVSPVSRALLDFAQSLLGTSTQTTSGWLRRVLHRS
ncbi:AAA family ATPase [Noviherbaspirillum sp. DKR-6]|uniref:AAA family ATPase n=2 Tax=Noviherbaspirillum pedocola TaxID=2801341 RepID=A0A934SQW9_9BURK|nr:AAA family ATPase [Noviherbaspirillum pedocola]